MSPHRGGNVISGPDIDKLTQRLTVEATAKQQAYIEELHQQIKDLKNQIKQAKGEANAAHHVADAAQKARTKTENMLASHQRDAAASRERRLKLVRINAHYRAQLINAGITPWKPAPEEEPSTTAQSAAESSPTGTTPSTTATTTTASTILRTPQPPVPGPST